MALKKEQTKISVKENYITIHILIFDYEKLQNFVTEFWDEWGKEQSDTDGGLWDMYWDRF